jgi:VWFA-related protein
MRKLLLVAVLTGCAFRLYASKAITVAELEQKLAVDRGKPDADLAQQLSEFELTERLSATTLSRLNSSSPGTKTSEELRILADQSAFLSLPATEIPAIPPPDPATQRKMMAQVVDYVSRTIHQLPNFYATRATTHFEETPEVQTAWDTIPFRPLHKTSAFDVTVLYRDGQEVVDAGTTKAKATSQKARGLNDWGVFGPILSTVFLDAAKSDLRWSHWEQTPTGTRAVFRYTVPLEKSHYQVHYCCVQANDPTVDPMKPFDRLVAYRGEIAVDPAQGSILRLTVEAELKPADPISKADIMVEYGPVEIGGQSYICATRSVALSTALSAYTFNARFRDLSARWTPGPQQKLLNDVAFEQYHMFRSDLRILPADEAQQHQPPATSPAEPAPQPETVQSASDHPGDSAIAPVAPSLPNPQTTQATETNQAPLFKATTREVVVDVVVTRSNGDPVLGLTKQDFEIREDSKQQTPDFFEEHSKSATRPSVQPEMPAMPTGARTNVPRAPASDAVNVLLIDTLNTGVQDQAYVRSEVMDFLTKMQPGTQMAIFALGSKLRCIQGFTSDGSVLLAALHDQRGLAADQKNSAYQSRSDQAADADDLSALQTMQASPSAIQALQAALADAGARNFGARASMTFEALAYLGHYLAGVPGRKNLIWFAGSFPVVVFPRAEQLAGLEKNPGLPGYLDRVKMTANLFTISQIAVYPISAEGVMTEHIGEADSAAAGGGGAHIGAMGDSVMAPYHQGAEARANAISAMEQLAASTGGKAYYNTNDLNAALQKAIDNGSNYYSIGYSPTNTNMDGAYRQIEVELAQGKYHLAYRRGYNAADAPSTNANSSPNASGIDPLAPLLKLGLPSATGVLYGVRAEPSAVPPSSTQDHAGQNPALKGPLTRYAVDFVIRSQDLVFTGDPQGGKSGKFLLGLKAYDRDGNALNWEGDEESVDLTPDQYDDTRQNGIPAHLSIDLPAAGEIHLVTAVYDLNSGIGGTLEIPVHSASFATGNASTPSNVKHP